MTVVLTIDPLWFKGVMSAACNKYANKNGNTQIEVPSASSLLPWTIPNAAKQLDKLVKAYGIKEPVEIFGWSQGAQIATYWMLNYKIDFSLVKRMIFIGNPQRAVKYGGSKGKNFWGKALPESPTNFPVDVYDITRIGDKYSDVPAQNPNGAGIHCNYFKVDLIDIIENGRFEKKVVVDRTRYIWVK